MTRYLMTAALLVVILAGAIAAVPTVSNNGGATGVTYNAATLNAQVSATGGVPASLWILWGTTDGTTNLATWANTNQIGNVSTNVQSTNITGLSGNELYYYRAYATNTEGSAWADATTNFVTDPTPPLPPGAKVFTVVVSSNGVVLWPTNFWTANASEFNASNQYGGIIDLATESDNNAGSLTNFPAAVAQTDAVPGLVVSSYPNLDTDSRDDVTTNAQGNINVRSNDLVGVVSIVMTNGGGTLSASSTNLLWDPGDGTSRTIMVEEHLGPQILTQNPDLDTNRNDDALLDVGNRFTVRQRFAGGINMLSNYLSECGDIYFEDGTHLFIAAGALYIEEGGDGWFRPITHKFNIPDHLAIWYPRLGGDTNLLMNIPTNSPGAGSIIVSDTGGRYSYQTNWGKTAWQWGNHADAGYLETGTNDFAWVRVANLGTTNAPVSTNGQFTGSATGWTLSGCVYSNNTVKVGVGDVGTITYTGATPVVQNRMYYLRFRRITSDSDEVITSTCGGVTNTWGEGASGYLTAYVMARTTNNPSIVVNAVSDNVSIDDVELFPISGGDLDVAGNAWVQGDLHVAGVVYGAGSVVTNLGDLADVDVGGAAAGKLLAYDGSSWVPTNAAAGGGGNPVDSRALTNDIDAAGYNLDSVGMIVAQTATTDVLRVTSTAEVWRMSFETNKLPLASDIWPPNRFFGFFGLEHGTSIYHVIDTMGVPVITNTQPMGSRP